ncbi:MAG: M20/M25/M40 family metallo-hydrolase [Firmicutes bacterium]|nr:M20/M25/M40 family metallo-hydrolase [Bacillota bacterium]
MGGRTWEQGDYPSWEYNPDSRLMDFVPKLYEKMFGKKAKIESIHAGLECGVFAGKIPGIDMISFGPDLFEVHSVNERLSISSAERMWDFLKEILKNID